MDNIIVQQSEQGQGRAFLRHSPADILHGLLYCGFIPAAQRRLQLLQIGIGKHIHHIRQRHVAKTDDFVIILQETVVICGIRLQIGR